MALADPVELTLPFVGPLHRGWLEWFLAGHALAGAEEFVVGPSGRGTYRRTLRLPHGPGIVELALHADHVAATLRLSDTNDLPTGGDRLRSLLDLDTDTTEVDNALSAIPQLTAAVGAAPGVRVPGSVDGAEVLLRTVLGQQISLAAARTAGSRLVAALGDPIEDPAGGLTHLFPTPAVVAERGHEVLTGPVRRIATVLRVAAALADGSLVVAPGRDQTELRAELVATTGIGPWTADYVSLRVLGSPDLLLDTDLVVRQGAELLGLPSEARELRAATQSWSPWRSYAGMHLWRVALLAREARRSPAGRPRGR